MPATKQKAQLLEQLTKLATAVIMEDDDDKPIVDLNQTERQIINLIGTGKVMGKTIAAALGRKQADGNPDTGLREMLGTLKRHGFLRNEKPDGYSVQPFWAHLVEEDQEGAA